jgi:leucyl/phenylalanyl-tRNA--protein transferase
MKLRRFFPDPRGSTPEGIVAIGGPLNTETLTEAYENGIFPWPHSEMPLLWFSPDPRGVLFFNELKVNRTLQKVLRNKTWTVSFNTCFKQVITNCQKQIRKGQRGTWITDEMIQAYYELFLKNQALSVEVWNNSKLVGGLYGVLSSKYFSAESMFFLESNASKYALIHMIEYLQTQGHQWMDLQMVTSVSRSLGAKEISRNEFLSKIQAS